MQLNNGATSVVLAGYSMGAAVSLQLARRSSLARYVQGLVLIGPVIDWLDVAASSSDQSFATSCR